MIQKLKQFLQFSLLAVVLLLAGCEKDLYEEPIYKENRYKAEAFSLSSITANKGTLAPNMAKLLEAVNQVRQKNAKAATSKIVYDSINNFYFDDENGLKISKDDYESYTFRVYRPNGDDKIENIVFSKNATNNFDSYITKYDLTEQNLQNYTESQLANTEKTIQKLNTPNPQEISNNDITSRDCYYFLMVPDCDCGRIIVVIGDCGDSGPGPGPSDGGYGGGLGDWGGGSGDTGGATNTTGPREVATSPVGGGSGSNQTNPCEKLKIKSNNPVFKGVFNNLNTTQKFGLTHETGFAEMKSYNQVGAIITTNQAMELDGEAAVKIPNNNNVVGAIHVHNSLSTNPDKNPVKMLSPADIKGLYTIAENTGYWELSTDDAYVMMLSDTGTYAIKVTDMNWDFFNIDWKKLKDDYEKDARKFVDGDGNFNPTQKQLQQLFFDTLNRVNLQGKVELYKATNVTANSTVTPQWARINPNNLNEEPCN